MMSRGFGSMSMLIAGMLIVAAGCARTPRPAEPPAVASRDQVQEMRDRYTRVNPNVRVGVVTGVLADDRLAAVGDVSVADFQVGQSMTLIDATGQTLAIGRIVRITENSLHLKYDAPAAGQRAPQAGDMAVRVPM